MTRIGQNPAKFVKDVAKPARITVAVLNYIPFLSGFYAEMDGVLKACLNSIYKTKIDEPFDILVFDNGSCDEIKQFLLQEQAEGRIQYLFLSEKNLGKGGAWNIIFEGAPGEIIAYTDNDCLFTPEWLSRSVNILETYPNVGMVTARPFRTNPELYTSTIKWADSTVDVTHEQGDIISFEVFREFDLSLGQSEEEIQKHYQETTDHKLTYRGINALVGASHWQFTSYKDKLHEFLPFQMNRPMGQVKQLDTRMNEKGYLRLMTDTPCAMNMSNTLDDSRKVAETAEKKKSAIAENPVVKKVLLGMYNRIFHLYYDKR
ncbi:MAG: glycosyltransferase family 2 protein [Anaerolineaceae bacterium]|nr:glycosyltransferase family 2 protein [Anaerolineaceae bacterium]